MHARTTLVAAALAGLAVTAVAGTASAAAPVAPEFALTVPTTIHAGAAASSFDGTLTTNDGATNVWVKTEITGADAADVHVEYQDGADWKSMPDTDSATPGLQLTFGDGDADADGVKGFSAPGGISNVTHFRISADKSTIGGDLHWSSELVTGDQGTEIARQEGTLAVTPSVPTFSLAVPHALLGGAAATQFAGTLSSNDGASNVWVKTAITGAGADHVHVEYLDGADWKPMTDTDAATPGQQLTFGDGDADADGTRGFSVPAGITNVTQFRIAADAGAQIGDLDWTSELVTGDAATVLRSSHGTVVVDLPVAAKATLGKHVEVVTYGRDVRVTGTVVDANHGDTPIADQAVTVYRKVGDAAPAVFGTATTDATGSFAVIGEGTASATYWAEAGDAKTEAAAVRTTKKISAAAVSRKHAKAGQKVRFTGTVLSPETAQTVRVQMLKKNGSWKTITTTTAKRSGAIKVATPLHKGERSYRLSVPASQDVDGTTSKSFTITVK